MKLIVVVLLFAGLALAPDASAKGPHAVLSSDAAAVAAGKPWNVTIEMMETRARRPPTLLARRQDRLIATRGRLAGSDGVTTRYRMRVVLPSDGRWRVTLVDGKRHFKFPSVAVGSGQRPLDYVAFPLGSRAHRQGGGGTWIEPDVPAGGSAEPLEPEVVQIADADSGDDDQSGIPFWMLPLAGLVVAGAGAGAWRLRRR
ncbi:MAG TPA: hypothetical protein VG126_07760 [Thermoleophilaceae bacterium]|nr:hypothetical protein [Thermoleophilaceae bacterium]